jgi:DNA-binding NtrC family response regulator
LEERCVDRVGGTKPIPVDVLVVAATNANLEEMVANSSFRADLYHRLNEIILRIPPLRERPSDVSLLLNHFVKTYSAEWGKAVRIAPQVCELLVGYDFPGNVRELKKLVNRLLFRAERGVIDSHDVYRELPQLASCQRKSGPVGLEQDAQSQVLVTQPADLEGLRKQQNQINQLFQKQRVQLVQQAIREAGGNVTKATERLRINRKRVYKILEQEVSTDGS